MHQAKSFSLGGPLLALGFGLAPRRELALLGREMRAGFQLVVFAGETVEENDLLRVLMFGLRHGAVTSGIALAARAFWTGDAEASASSVVSASCYRLSEYVVVLAVVMPELKLVKIQGQIFLADVVVRPDDSPFEKAPEGFDIVRVSASSSNVPFANQSETQTSATG